MARILKGAPVTAGLNEKMSREVEQLKSQGIIPTLCILRVGEEPDDLTYEKNAIKRCEKVGVEVKLIKLERNVDQATFDKTLMDINQDESIHGVLMFRPLPEQLDSERARQMLSPSKDVDGCTDGSLAGVLANSEIGFPPCTAEAVLEMLEFYEIPYAGKRVVIVGRSLVVGLIASVMLTHGDATVTTCHTKTPDVAKLAKEADILISAAGKLKLVDLEYTNENQSIIDVGINFDEERGIICGDVDFDLVEPKVKDITPVPGGIGSVTTCILVKHVIEAAKRRRTC